MHGCDTATATPTKTFIFLIHHQSKGRPRMCLLWKRTLDNHPKRTSSRDCWTLECQWMCWIYPNDSRPVLDVLFFALVKKMEILGVQVWRVLVLCAMTRCIGCGNWCCAHRSLPEGADYFRDINTYLGNNGFRCHISGKLTCLISCHPHYLMCGLTLEHEEVVGLSNDLEPL
jgi:hypothetical protein